MDSLSPFAELPKEIQLQIWRDTFPPPRTARIRLVNDWEGIHANTNYFWKNDPDITLSDAEIAKHEWYGYHRRNNSKKHRSPETPVALEAAGKVVRKH